MEHSPASSGYARSPEDTAIAAMPSSSVSWTAILAGGLGAAAFALILLTLGTGLGLTAISPWKSAGTNAKAFGFAAVIWICVTSVLTSGLGGYLAGRLRHRWTTVDLDEVHFRDTAHGFLSWAVATLFTAMFVTLAATAAIRPGAAIGAGSHDGPLDVNAPIVERGDAAAAFNAWPVGYFVDSLYRIPAGVTPPPAAMTGGEAVRVETTRIFLNSVGAGGPLSPEDTEYLGRLVAQRTGLATPDAQARVTTTYTRLQQKRAALDAAAKDGAEKARRATISASLWLFVSLLMGAFSASLLATHGGRARDVLIIHQPTL
ncbi:hypothetical protein [Paraburkholderia sp.]|uniref:hypothetical protein n=1 Tax=Paraburkholderia sp. TaxID=1926495 RepID=UPI002387463F|nr:hypothetical protein [Paraburkholderia sp.]MDE1180998.1 hypothetical protein [Paraburkholderia sp.]